MEGAQVRTDQHLYVTGGKVHVAQILQFSGAATSLNPVLVLSRNSCTAECVVFADADGTTDSMTANPVLEEDFTINWGDGSAGTRTVGSSNSVVSCGAGMTATFTAGTGNVSSSNLVVTALLTSTVPVGATISGSGTIPANTKIQSQSTNTGTLGQPATYVLSGNVTIADGTTITATLPDYCPAFAQMPAAQDGNVDYAFAAAHVYTVAGHYTVTLTVTGPSGTKTTTQTVDVANPDTVYGGTWSGTCPSSTLCTCKIESAGGPAGSKGCTACFSTNDSAFTSCPAGGSANADPLSVCSQAMSPRTCDWASIELKYYPASAIQPMRVLFRRGETFGMSSNNVIRSNGAVSPQCQIGAYDSGAQPIISVTAAAAEPNGPQAVGFGAGTTGVADCAVHDIQVTAASGQVDLIAFGVNSNSSHILIHNVTAVATASLSFTSVPNAVPKANYVATINASQSGFSGSSADGCMGMLASSDRESLYSAGVNHAAFMGNYVTDSTEHGQHILRDQGPNAASTDTTAIHHQIIAYNFMARSCPSKETDTIRGNNTKFAVHDNIIVPDGQGFANTTLQPQDVIYNENITVGVYERNFDIYGGGQNLIVKGNSIVVRLNIAQGNQKPSSATCLFATVTNGTTAGSPDPANNSFFNNTNYCGSAGTAEGLSYLASASGTKNIDLPQVANNNLVYGAAASAGQFIVNTTNPPITPSTSNNSSNSQTHATNPNFVNAGGSFLLPTDFKLVGGCGGAGGSSYAKCGGVSGGAGIPYFDFGRNRMTGTYSIGAWNFLLRRDLGHANDNRPMWLNEVA
jgi:hypothetical protein